MISDALFDAIMTIQEYERDMPDTYGSPEMKVKIYRVKRHMEHLMVELDAPPITPEEVAEAEQWRVQWDANIGERETTVCDACRAEEIQQAAADEGHAH